MLTIEGEITLTTPLHITTPGSFKVDEEGRIGNSGKPITRVTQMPLALRHPIELPDDRVLSRVSIPCINANLLRGRIRRECAAIIFESLEERDETIPLSMAHILTCLSYGNPNGGTRLDYELIKKARDHVYAGLWGGGPDMLKSGLVVHNALPITDLTINEGFVPLGARSSSRNERSVNGQRNLLGHTGLTYVTHIFKKDDIIHFSDPMMPKIVTKYETVVPELQSKIFDGRKKRKDDPTQKKSDIDNMFAVEMVMPGVSFTFRLELAEYLSDAQTGLILLALERIKRKQGLGGWLRAGLGKFDFKYHLYEENLDGSTDSIDDELIEEYKKQALESASHVSEEDLVAIYAQPENELKKKAS